MKRTLFKALSGLTAILWISAVTAGCSSALGRDSSVATSYRTTTTLDDTGGTSQTTGDANQQVTATGLDSDEWFSRRDLEQTVDVSAATSLSLENGTDLTIREAGVYLLRGEAQEVTLDVDAASNAKVQIVLDGVTIRNEDSPVIHVKNADKVFVTKTASQNSLEVAGDFADAGNSHLDAVIFSKTDLTLNGTGSLSLVAARGNGISSKDDLVITGGEYQIFAAADGMEANDSIRIGGGTLTIEAGQDALQSENAEDPSLGYVVIQNGTLNISAGNDAIRGNRIVQIDGGTMDIATCREGIEANTILINGGQIIVNARDDGFNASRKDSAEAAIIVNGGNIKVHMAGGDTDAFDSNGSITINGGTITVEGQSAFDANGLAVMNGGTVTVNGQAITQITQSQPGGPGGSGGDGGTGGTGGES